MKRFMFGSILRKLPLFIIFTVVLCSVAIFSASSVSFLQYVGGGYYNYYNELSSGLAPLIVFFFIFMMVLPLFSMNYRYSLAKADTFKQAPFKDKTIRYAEHLSSLVIVIIGYTISLAMFAGILAFRNMYAESPNYYFVVIMFHYEHFFSLYFFTVLAGVLQYFISYLLVSRSNSIRNSIITLIMGEGALGFAVFIIFMFATVEKSTPMSALMFGGSSFMLPIFFFSLVYNSLIVFDENYISLGSDYSYLNSSLDIAALIIGVSIFVLVAILGIITFFIEKDPSGEFAGKPNTKRPYQEVIFHVGFALIGALLSMLLARGSLITFFLFLVFFLATYYPLYGTLRKNFKLNPIQIGIMAGVVLFIVVVGFSYSVLYQSVNGY